MKRVLRTERDALLVFIHFLFGSSWNRVGEFRVWGLKKAVHFIAILDFDAASDLASEMDGKNGEATSAAMGCV